MWGWMDGSNEARDVERERERGLRVMEGGEMEGSCLLPRLVFAKSREQKPKNSFFSVTFYEAKEPVKKESYIT